MVVFPELTLTGYPPEDLLLRADLLERPTRPLISCVFSYRQISSLLWDIPRARGEALFNSVGVIHEGQVLAEYDKQCLPNYQVFDEKRYFRAGSEPCVVALHGLSVGLTICEDIWHAEPVRRGQSRWRRYSDQHQRLAVSSR